MSFFDITFKNISSNSKIFMLANIIIYVVKPLKFDVAIKKLYKASTHENISASYNSCVKLAFVTKQRNFVQTLNKLMHNSPSFKAVYITAYL